MKGFLTECYICRYKYYAMRLRFLFILILFPAFLFAQDEGGDRGYIVKVGDMCPDFVIETPNGEKTSMNELRGQVVMLQFTASWCGVCRKEMPHIEKDIWQAYKDKGLILYGIDRGETPEVTSAFAEKMKITYPLALDEDESIFQKFALKKAGVTRNILVDENGKIVYLTRLFNMDEFNGLVEKIGELLD